MTPVYLSPQMVKRADTMQALERVPAESSVIPGLARTGPAALAMSPLLPWSTVGALRDKFTGKETQNELPQAAVTDTGRGVGALIGMGAARGIGETTKLLPTKNPMLHAAFMLAGAGGGALLGHMKGRNVAQELFPGSLHDRLQRAMNNF